MPPVLQILSLVVGVAGVLLGLLALTSSIEADEKADAVHQALLSLEKRNHSPVLAIRVEHAFRQEQSGAVTLYAVIRNDGGVSAAKARVKASFGSARGAIHDAEIGEIGPRSSSPRQSITVPSDYIERVTAHGESREVRLIASLGLSATCANGDASEIIQVSVIPPS